MRLISGKRECVFSHDISLSKFYSGLQSRVRCGAICLIALFVALSDRESNQERGASKQLAPPLTYKRFQTDLEAQPQSHRNGTASAAALLEVIERSAGVIERDAARNAEVRVIKRVEHLEPIPQLEAFGDPKVLEDAQIHVFIAIPQEGIAPDVAERRTEPQRRARAVEDEAHVIRRDRSEFATRRGQVEVVQQVEACRTGTQIWSRYVAHLCAATEPVEDACVYIRDRHPIKGRIRIALERAEV